MTGFLLRRLGSMVLVLLAISVLVFLIFFATPGTDPARQLAGRNPTPQTLGTIRHDFGLDKPLPVRYAHMMDHLLIRRDLTSYTNRGQKVVPKILAAAPVTLSLVLGAAAIWVVLAVLIGTAASVWRGRWWSGALMYGALIAVCVPGLWLGQMANLVSQSAWHDTFLFNWVPPLGYVSFFESPLGWFKALVIPWIVLAIAPAGLYARVLYGSLGEARHADFVRTARAKGISRTRVLFRHELRTSLIAFVSLFGLDFAALVGGGALLMEVIFGLHGVGYLTYQALTTLDLPTLMGTVTFAAFFVVMSNAAVDLLYGVLDPRVRAL